MRLDNKANQQGGETILCKKKNMQTMNRRY